MSKRQGAETLKILLVIDGMHPRDGGPPAVVAGSAAALLKRGHEVEILTTAQAGDEIGVSSAWLDAWQAGVRLTNVAPVGVRGVWSSATAAVVDAVNRNEVVHLHGLWNPFLWQVARTCRQRHRPYLVSIHGTLDHRALRRTWPKWIKKRIAIEIFGLRGYLRDAAAVVFGSAAEAAQSWLLEPRMKLAYIPNGVSSKIGDHSPSQEMLQTLESAAPALPTWRRSLLSFSRIHPEKGLDMLVRAFHEVCADFPDAGLLIAGLRQDEAYEAEVRRLVSQGPGVSRIAMTTALTGPGSQFLYERCSIFVLPSHAEGFSMALTEALARGRPILATTFCHMPEIAQRQAGVVVDPNPAAIAAGLRALLSASDAALHSMGAASRELFLEKYTWERVACALEEAYQLARSGRA